MTHQLAQVLTLVRMNTPDRANVGLLSMEAFLLVAAHPEGLTYEDLQRLTGAAHGPVSRAVLVLTVYFHKRRGVVKRPCIHLLQRRKRPGQKGYRVYLTSAGKALLAQAGLPTGM